VSKNISRNPLFGPVKYQGFGIFHPYYHQQIKHIATLFQEVLAGTQTGVLLRATAEQFRLELGFPFDITACTYSVSSVYTTSSWYRELWRFFSTHPSIVVSEDFPDPPLLRTGDEYLMRIFIRAGYRGEQLRLLNEIRMALRVITVGDIANADGHSIRHSAFLLQRGNCLRENYDWPRPVPLTPRLHTLWKRALRSCLLRHPNIPSSRKLCFHLCVGTWLVPNIADSWDWFACVRSNRLYHRIAEGWEYQKLEGG